MEMSKYQYEAMKTAVYNQKMYPVASLMVEAGELADLFIKPWLRGDNIGLDKDEIKAEAGDVLWMLTAILSDAGLSLSEVAEYNVEKLRDREARGVIKGTGDNR